MDEIDVKHIHVLEFPKQLLWTDRDLEYFLEEIPGEACRMNNDVYDAFIKEVEAGKDYSLEEAFNLAYYDLLAAICKISEVLCKQIVSVEDSKEDEKQSRDMVTCAIFNYQFDKIIEQARQGEFEGLESVVMTADEAFPVRQNIFGEMLVKDFKKTSQEDEIHFKNEHGPKEYIHRHLIPPTDDIMATRLKPFQD